MDTLPVHSLSHSRPPVSRSKQVRMQTVGLRPLAQMHTEQNSQVPSDTLNWLPFGS